MTRPLYEVLFFPAFGPMGFYWSLGLVPSLPYVLLSLSYGRVLRHKSQVIEGFMSNSAIFAAYATRFGTATHGKKAISELIGIAYHWRLYALAILLNVTVVGAGVYVCLIRSGVSMGLPSPFEAMLAATPSALLLSLGGAYVLNLYDLLKRYRVGDLYPSCLHFHWLHMVVAAFLGPLLAQAFSPGVSRVVAFGVGAFPLKDSLDAARKYAAKRMELSPTGPVGETSTLARIQGLTPEIIERLEEEGVTSSEHLAYSDPVRLLLRTNIPWVILIDLIDQALLFNYVGDRVTQLRPMGVRGSIEMAAIAQYLDKGDAEEKRCAGIALRLVASKLGLTDDEALILVRGFAADGQVQLLWELYTPEFPDEVLAAVHKEGDIDST